VLDSRLSLPPRLALLRPRRSAASTLVVHATAARRGIRLAPGVELLRVRRGPGGLSLRQLLAALAARGVVHLLVEGGARVHASFLAEGLVDRVAVVVAPRIAGEDGVPLAALRGPARMRDAIALEAVEVVRLGEDVLVTGTPARTSGARRSALAKPARRG
jgi:diaminohydroxyphosphoribosylaminopyrimidine deaminase/5-amino-6-(5-phosphoribosylamino)uracil reductase